MQLCIVDSLLQDLGIARIHSLLQFFGCLCGREGHQALKTSGHSCSSLSDFGVLCHCYKTLQAWTKLHIRTTRTLPWHLPNDQSFPWCLLFWRLPGTRVQVWWNGFWRTEWADTFPFCTAKLCFRNSVEKHCPVPRITHGMWLPQTWRSKVALLQNVSPLDLTGRRALKPVASSFANSEKSCEHFRATP